MLKLIIYDIKHLWGKCVLCIFAVHIRYPRWVLVGALTYGCWAITPPAEDWSCGQMNWGFGSLDATGTGFVVGTCG